MKRRRKGIAREMLGALLAMSAAGALHGCSSPENPSDAAEKSRQGKSANDVEKSQDAQQSNTDGSTRSDSR